MKTGDTVMLLYEAQQYISHIGCMYIPAKITRTKKDKCGQTWFTLETEWDGKKIKTKIRKGERLYRMRKARNKSVQKGNK